MKNIFKNRAKNTVPLKYHFSGNQHTAKPSSWMLESYSPVMGQMFRTLRKLLNSRTPLLFSGEAGTGKRTLAQAAHRSSHRGNEPFVAIDCRKIDRAGFMCQLRANLPENGRSNGSGFSGTILLTHVDALDAGLQALILAMLQQREFVCEEKGPVVPFQGRFHGKEGENALRGSFLFVNMALRSAAGYPITHPFESLNSCRKTTPSRAF